MNSLIFIYNHCASRILELLPWFMLAIVVGRLLSSMRLDMLTSGGLRRRNTAAIVGTTLFGSFTPFCACAIVPIIRAVLRAGVPLSVVMAFWISSPAMAPEEFGLTARAFGMRITLVRLAGAILVGIGAALVAKYLEHRGLLTHTSREDATADSATTTTTASCCAPAPAAAAPAAHLAAGSLSAAGSATATGTATAVLDRPATATTPAAGTAVLDRPATATTPAAGTAVLDQPVTGTALLTVEDVTTSSCCTTPVTLDPPAAASCCAPAITAPDTAATCSCTPAQDTSSCCTAPAAQDTSSCCGNPAPAGPAPHGWKAIARQSLREIKLRPFTRGLLKDSWTLGRWMLLGILLEAVITRWVPATAFGGLLGGHDLPLAVLIAGLLSIPLYLNGISAIPIGLALLNMGLNPAALVTFLLAGSITTVPALAGVRSVVTNRVFTLYVAAGTIGPMIIGLLAAPILR